MDLSTYSSFDNDTNENRPSTKEMVAYMLTVLMEYEKSLGNKQDPKVNPMSGRVVMELGDGRMYEIPEHIQRHAIEEYAKMKQEEPEYNRLMNLRRYIPNVMPPKQCKKTTIILILLFLAILYFLYKYMNDNVGEYEGIRFNE